ncbi:hypothetical protein PEC18_35285 [Paucibacter sp. O1-1]|nr:hypothetical protein [Paucibacter sp. O1-1]MDA3830935.1 hypothetical protein [Paucibacter sp. O1-1]
MVSHYDLKENAQYHADPQVGYATMLEFMATDRLDEMLADFDDLKRGLITERRLCAPAAMKKALATRAACRPVPACSTASPLRPTP